MYIYNYVYLHNYIYIYTYTYESLLLYYICICNAWYSQCIHILKPFVISSLPHLRWPVTFSVPFSSGGARGRHLCSSDRSLCQRVRAVPIPGTQLVMPVSAVGCSECSVSCAADVAWKKCDHRKSDSCFVCQSYPSRFVSYPLVLSFTPVKY